MNSVRCVMVNIKKCIMNVKGTLQKDHEAVQVTFLSVVNQLND